MLEEINRKLFSRIVETLSVLSIIALLVLLISIDMLFTKDGLSSLVITFVVYGLIHLGLGFKKGE